MSCFQHKLIDMITNSFRNFILNWEKIWKLLSVSYCEMFLKINMVSRPSTVKLCDHVHCETFLKINVSSIYSQTLWSCPLWDIPQNKCLVHLRSNFVIMSISLCVVYVNAITAVYSGILSRKFFTFLRYKCNTCILWPNLDDQA